MTWNFKPEDYEKAKRIENMKYQTLKSNTDYITPSDSEDDDMYNMIHPFAEIERLKRYEELVHFIYNDYTELSHHKIENQNIYWKKLCFKLINEDHPFNEALKIETPLKDNF